MINWQKVFGENTYYSFILDPFILVGVGMFAVWLAVRKFYKRFGRNKMILLGLALLGLTLTWFGAGALYFDVIDMPLLGEAGQGNPFMWNSGCELLGIEPFVDTTTPTYADFLSPLNILAFFLFIVVYPFILYVGIHLGYILFGRNEKQTGLIELLKP